VSADNASVQVGGGRAAGSLMWDAAERSRGGSEREELLFEKNENVENV